MSKFVPRERKRRKLDKQKSTGHQQSNDDPNAFSILPASKSEKEERRQKLRDELRAQQPSVSGKKKKRLDKYIDNKLRKEENLELIKKLANTKVDTSLFHSSQKLGSTRSSKRERLSRAFQEREAGINVAENEDVLLQARDIANDGEEDASDSDGSVDGKPASEVKPTSVAQSAPKRQVPAFGSGLKRPLELDEQGRPVIKKRQRVVPQKPPIVFLNRDEDSITSEEEWMGFSDQDKDNSISATVSSRAGREQGSAEISDEREEVEDDDDEDISDASDASDDASGEDGISAFKAWAVKQRNDTLGFVPSADSHPQVTQVPHAIKHDSRPDVDVEPLPPELEVPKEETNRKVYSVTVDRPPEIQEARLKLPVVAEEQKIMEAIHNNDVVVIWGATGSGKTTQIPQFLLEAGYGDKGGPTPGLIGVTQPRRVAAVSMAERVGEELGSMRNKSAYKIRFDGTVGPDTAIKFMTDGVLLREISTDIQLSKYSAIIIDEAHERSVNTDILIGMLSRTVMNIRSARAPKVDGIPSLPPLKLIIMSATLRVKDFLENPRLFPNGSPPLVKAEGRQYPVTVHFSRRTHSDYIEEAFKKVSRGHKKLPKGSMLVFLTGQNEIVSLEKRLKHAFSTTQQSSTNAHNVKVSASDAPLEVEDMEIKSAGLEHDGSDDEVEIRGLDDYSDDGEDEEFEVDQTEEERKETSNLKAHILPLYSQLPTREQLRVFEPPPEGSRLIVLATNVAETSLTIPGVRYVFDCGRAKEKKHNLHTGVQSFEIGWISKASAEQRAGRAGRTGPGHCYRLYSSALYEAHLEEHTDPEILRTPMEDVVLQIRGIGLKDVASFPFPTPPARQSINKAEKLLRYIGAISTDGKLSDIGRRLSTFPLSPRFSRMLLLALERRCSELGIAIVAAVTVPELFVPENLINHNAAQNQEDEQNSQDDESAADEARRKAYNAAHHGFSNLDVSSDALKLFSALRAYSAEAATDNSPPPLERWCAAHFLRSKALREATQLRQQLTSIARRNYPESAPAFGMAIPKPKDADVRLLRGIVAAGFVDQVAIRTDLLPTPPALPRKPTRAVDVAYQTRFPSESDAASSGHGPASVGQFVFVHPSSLLARRSASKMPAYVIFSRLQRSSGSGSRVRMHPLTPVSGADLARLARGTPLLEVSKPLDRVESVSVNERICNVAVSLVGEQGSTPWPLTTWRVRQQRSRTRGWEIAETLD